jgi:hypothetical protein
LCIMPNRSSQKKHPRPPSAKTKTFGTDFMQSVKTG